MLEPAHGPPAGRAHRRSIRRATSSPSIRCSTGPSSPAGRTERGRDPPARRLHEGRRHGDLRHPRRLQRPPRRRAPAPEGQLSAPHAGHASTFRSSSRCRRSRADEDLLHPRQTSPAATPRARPGSRPCRPRPRARRAARPAPATASRRSSSPRTISPPPGPSGRAAKRSIPSSAAIRASAKWPYRSGINIVMYALTGNYKADQVHVPALLERLGQ